MADRIRFAIFDPSPEISVLKEDIYTSICAWLRDGGIDVSVERSDLPGSGPIIISGFEYLSDAMRLQVARSGRPYALLDVEILNNYMVNFKPETRPWFEPPVDEIFKNSRFLLTYYQSSARFINKSYGTPTYTIQPGYCSALHAYPSLTDEEKDIDVLFFGRVYDDRAPLLQRIADQFETRILDVPNLTPLFLRNEYARRARIILHLGHRQPFQHIGMMRLLSMAHLRAFSLSEWRLEIEDSLANLSAWWQPDTDICDVIASWLTDAGGRERQAELTFNTLQNRNVAKELANFVSSHFA